MQEKSCWTRVSSCVRRIEGICDLRPEREKRMHVHGSGSDLLLKSAALQELHRDEPLARVFADFVDCADVGMIQRGSCARFAQKTLEGLLIARHFSGKKLQRDSPA